MNILSRTLRLVCHLHVLKLENCGLSGRSIAMLGIYYVIRFVSFIILFYNVHKMLFAIMTYNSIYLSNKRG